MKLLTLVLVLSCVVAYITEISGTPQLLLSDNKKLEEDLQSPAKKVSTNNNEINGTPQLPFFGILQNFWNKIKKDLQGSDMKGTPQLPFSFQNYLNKIKEFQKRITNQGENNDRGSEPPNVDNGMNSDLPPLYSSFRWKREADNSDSGSESQPNVNNEDEDNDFDINNFRWKREADIKPLFGAQVQMNLPSLSEQFKNLLERHRRLSGQYGTMMNYIRNGCRVETTTATTAAFDNIRDVTGHRIETTTSKISPKAIEDLTQGFRWRREAEN
ncbi:PREDICTED: uncharacterized protein LOC105455646 isoform X2 [Wasmannia auropunctata]|uniref:uncharacterized protein LOC105455646 isoform X2 n=1 Tax=Wasmannia auropunctata TaxID=64793 RepID=UPI0005EE4B2C|nr:PREDICTED: uncharacterized protein LOC105455646 isoform X2 [Wasmannia auropunctata]